MAAQLKVQKHPEADTDVGLLPRNLMESFENLEQRLMNGDDLSEFIHTKPHTPRDAISTRTLIEHYHLQPCTPVCYLVGLVRSVDTVYILDVFEHPPRGTFASSGLEERLYSRLSDVCPGLSEYKLPGTFRSGLPVLKSDLYNPGSVKGRPSVVPVRASDSDYLPLGQLPDVPDGQISVAIKIGSFGVHQEDIPAEAVGCIEDDEHPARECLTIYSAGLKCRLGIYRKETEHIIFAFCPMHHVVIRASNMEIPLVFALEEQEYRSLIEPLREKFPSIDGREQELGALVDHLISHFPLRRA